MDYPGSQRPAGRPRWRHRRSRTRCRGRAGSTLHPRGRRTVGLPGPQLRRVEGTWCAAGHDHGRAGRHRRTGSRCQPGVVPLRDERGGGTNTSSRRRMLERGLRREPGGAVLIPASAGCRHGIVRRLRFVLMGAVLLWGGCSALTDFDRFRGPSPRDGGIETGDGGASDAAPSSPERGQDARSD